MPEALPRTLEELRVRVQPGDMDRVWVFPPLRKGRRERGLVAVSVFLADAERRSVLTGAYTAERSGLELKVDATFTQEGEAPPEFLPRVMEGVVRRAGEGLGEPREVEISRDPGRFAALLHELSAEAAAEEVRS